MKNIFLSTIILFLIILSSDTLAFSHTYQTQENISSYKTYKTLDFKNENKEAENIFLQYFLKEHNLSLKQYKEMSKDCTYCYIKADEIDLNNDGINEVIGYNNMMCGAVECVASVLEEQNNEWVEISSFSIIRGSNIDILEDKNENYHSIRPNCENIDTAAKENLYILKYKNNGYNSIIKARKEDNNL